MAGHTQAVKNSVSMAVSSSVSSQHNSTLEQTENNCVITNLLSRFLYNVVFACRHEGSEHCLREQFSSAFAPWELPLQPRSDQLFVFAVDSAVCRASRASHSWSLRLLLADTLVLSSDYRWNYFERAVSVSCMILSGFLGAPCSLFAAFIRRLCTNVLTQISSPRVGSSLHLHGIRPGPVVRI